MDILSKIVAVKRREVEARKALLPQELLEQSNAFGSHTLSLSNSIRNVGIGIIAEHKRRSPSKSVINETASLAEVVTDYEIAGAAGVSILTDTSFFGGSTEDLSLAASLLSIPVLRKEFIIDPYQIVESRAFGADAILLIAAILSDSELVEFSRLAKSLGLNVLLEVHDHEELKRSVLPDVDMIGVNNRNLKTFEVSIETSKELAEHIPQEYVKVSESGISNVAAIRELRNFGYQGFLIGESFMKTTQPGAAARNFIEQL